MSEQDHRHLLGNIDRLADLYAMAKLRGDTSDIYAVQDSLRDEHAQKNTPYKWTMPLRHLYKCRSKEHMVPERLYRLCNPQPHDAQLNVHEVEIREGEIHEVLEHGATLSDEQVRFLRNIR